MVFRSLIHCTANTHAASGLHTSVAEQFKADVPERERSVRTGAAGLSGAAQGRVGEGGSEIIVGAVFSQAVSLRTCKVSCWDPSSPW
jgi:hypothetical protein